MIAQRKIFGRTAFILSSLAVVGGSILAGFGAFGALYTMVALMIEIFFEVRTLQLGLARSGLVAVASTSGAAGVGLGLYLKFRGLAQLDLLRAQLNEMVTKVAALTPSLKVDPEIVWLQLPAVFCLSLIVALCLAVVFEERVVAWVTGADAAKRRPAGQNSGGSLAGEVAPARGQTGLRDFRLPDALIWISIVALLGAFWDHGRATLQVLSLNVFYILVFLYFLQGMAVVVTYFDALKVSPFWRSIWLFVLIVQLLVLVSLIGFSDYWLDYRQKIARKLVNPRNGI